MTYRCVCRAIRDFDVSHARTRVRPDDARLPFWLMRLPLQLGCGPRLRAGRRRLLASMSLTIVGVGRTGQGSLLCHLPRARAPVVRAIGRRCLPAEWSKPPISLMGLTLLRPVVFIGALAYRKSAPGGAVSYRHSSLLRGSDGQLRRYKNRARASNATVLLSHRGWLRAEAEPRASDTICNSLM
jgi:hypothetical protein